MQNKRVSDNVYDELKLLSALGENCVLQFRGDNGGIVAVATTIRDVFEDEDGQYLLGQNGLTLQLNRLITINGKALEQFC
jgi:hypothetical protein